MSFPSSLRQKSLPKETEEQEKFNPSNQSFSMPSTFKKKEKPKTYSDEDYMSDEELEREIDRQKARTITNIGTTLLGMPGDLLSFAMGLFGKEQNILPESQSLQKGAEKLSGGYLSPKSETEERGDEFIKDIATMAVPGGGSYGVMRNIGIPVVANLVKEGMKYGNSSEKSQAYGKIGTMIALDLATRNKGGVKTHINELWNKAEESIPKGVSIDASNLSKSLDTLWKTLSAGGNHPSTKKALEKVGEIRNEIMKNGKIALDRLIPFRKSINEVIDEIGGFNFEIPFKSKKAAKFHLNEVKGKVIDAVNEYAEKFNPELATAWKNANEASAAFYQSNKIAKFLEKISFVPQSKLVQSLFSFSPIAGTAKLATMSLPGAAATGIAASAYQAFKVLNRSKNSKVLRKYYQNAVKEASIENIPQTVKNLKALDENAKKEED